MLTAEPLVECLYGWGRMLRLYPDCIDLHGTSYTLSDLIYVRSSYHYVMGVPSASIELRFRRKKVLVRGIASITDAQKIIAFLESVCPPLPLTPAPQAQTPVPEPEVVTKADAYTPIQGMSWRTLRQNTSDTEFSPSLHSPIQGSGQGLTPIIQGDWHTASIPSIAPDWKRERQKVRERKPTRSERKQREPEGDVEQLTQLLQKATLPQIDVPTRLLPGEYAHYRTQTTLCRELVSEPGSYRYVAKDYGMLIFTNKRLIFIGRKSQFVLCYERLLHVSRLRNALAFLAEHWPRREVCEVDRPLECAMYLETILKRFHEQQLALEDDLQQSDAERPLALEEIDTIRFPSEGWSESKLS